MNILNSDDILHNILYYTDFKTIEELLKIDKNNIVKHYQIYGINLNMMPIFVPCHDIVLYIEHYHSYISGTNFPDQPLWLFRSKEDVKFNSRYQKIDNIRFDRPNFYGYITSYQRMEFYNSIDCWKQLSTQQKYLFWCAITGTHPEIKLDKTLCSPYLDGLISESYWHYPQSFVRYYLDIYLIDTCDLRNAKCIASGEIEKELKFLTSSRVNNLFNVAEKEHLEEMKEEFDKLKNHPQMEFILSNHKINNYQDMMKLFYHGKILDFSNEQYILDESKILRNIIKEIKELEIIKTTNLKTSNLNYLFHIEANYDNNSSEQTYCCTQ